MSNNNIRTVIEKINKACDDFDFINARKLIEYNMNELSKASYYRLLNSNACVLLKHLIDTKNSHQFNGVTRTDLLIIDNINKYCSNFDIAMLKRAIKNSFDLLQRPDIFPLLNQDAKIILTDMGAILGSPEIVNEG
jgi:hypothetical protein